MKINSRLILAILSFVVTLVLLWYFSNIVTYIILAWVLSMIGAPLFNLFNRWLNNAASAGLTLAVFTIILFILFSIAIPPLFKQARNLASIDYESMLVSLEEPIADVETWLINKGLYAPKDEDEAKDHDHGLEDEVLIRQISLDSLAGSKIDSTDLTLLISVNTHPEQHEEKSINGKEDLLYQLRNNFVSFFDLSRIPEFFGSAFGVVGNFMIAFLSIYFIAFFFLKEKGLFLRMVQGIIPDQYESNASHAIDESSSLLVRYFIGVIVQVTTITIIVSAILGILGVKNALLIGLFAGTMNVIPYLGPFIGLAFGTFITISSYVELSFYEGMLPILIKVIIVLAIIQILDNFIFQPLIFSKSVKAHPLEIFIIVLAGAKLGGILGMILAIPVYTVFRVLGKVFFSEYKLVQRITKSI